MTKAQELVKDKIDLEDALITLRKIKIDLLKNGIVKIEPRRGFLWVCVNDMFVVAISKRESKYDKLDKLNIVYNTVRSMQFWFIEQENKRRLAA